MSDNMVRLGFPSDSPLGQLYRITEARLKKDGQSIEILNKGYQTLDGDIENDPEVLQADELLEFTYAHPQYYADLYRLGFPLPFVPDDFDPKTSEDEAFRAKFREILAGVKREAVKKFDPVKMTDQFRVTFLTGLEKSLAVFIPRVDTDCFPKTLLEMKNPGCISSSSQLLLLHAAFQATGLADIFSMGYNLAALSIPNWEEEYESIKPWEQVIDIRFGKSSQLREGGWTPGIHFALTPYQLTGLWLQQRWFYCLKNKEWREAERLAFAMRRMHPERVRSWRALPSVYGQSGDLEKYHKTVLEFETRFRTHEDFPFERAMIKFDQIQWEWEQGIIQEGELVAVLKELESSLERSQGESSTEYAENSYEIAKRLWKFAEDLTAMSKEKRIVELKSLLKKHSFQILLRSIETNPTRIGTFLTAHKMATLQELPPDPKENRDQAIEQTGQQDPKQEEQYSEYLKYLEDLSQFSQRLLAQNPDNPFFLYFACLVQEDRYNANPTIPPEAISLWRSQLTKLQRFEKEGRSVLRLLADSFSSLDDFPTAISYYKKFREKLPKGAPRRPLLYLIIAQKYAALGEKEKAFAELAAFKLMFPKEKMDDWVKKFIELLWERLIDEKSGWIQTHSGAYAIFAAWFKENGASIRVIDNLSALIVLGSWGGRASERAKTILADRGREPNFIEMLYHWGSTFRLKIHHQSSTRRRLDFLTYLGEGLKNSGLMKHSKMKQFYLEIQITLLQEAFYLKDEEAMKQAMVEIISSNDGKFYLTAINLVYLLLSQHRGDSEKRKLVYLFFVALEKYQQHWPSFFNDILKIRYRDAAAIFVQEGELEQAQWLGKQGGIDDGR